MQVLKIIPFALLVLLLTAPEPTVRDDRRELLRKAKATGTDFVEQFSGKKIRGELWARRKETETLVCTFDLAVKSHDIWRMNSTTNGNTAVYCQNGNFAFEAALSETGAFYYTLFGFDRETTNSIRESVLARNQLSSISTQVFGIELTKFLSLSNLKIVSREPTKTPQGFEAERIHWECSAEPPLMPKSSFGELVFLPGDGFQIAYCGFTFGVRNNSSAPPTLTFESVFRRIDNKLIPEETKKHETKISYICKLSEISALTENASYFEPESIGLEKPTNPNRFQFLWWIMGFVFAALAVLAIFLKSSKK